MQIGGSNPSRYTNKEAYELLQKQNVSFFIFCLHHHLQFYVKYDKIQPVHSSVQRIQAMYQINHSIVLQPSKKGVKQMASHAYCRFILQTPDGYLTPTGASKDIGDKNVVVLNIYGVGGAFSSREKNIERFLQDRKSTRLNSSH